MFKVFAVLLVMHISGIRAQCDYNSVIWDFNGLKLLQMGEGYLIANQQNNTIIPRGKSVVLFCESEFQQDARRKHDGWQYTTTTEPTNYKTEEIGKLLKIDCDDNRMRLSMHASSVKKDLETGRGSIKCHSNSGNFYSNKLDDCQNEGLRFGFTVNNIPIVLLELCYDFNKSELIFSHYVAARRSFILERQTDYNPSNVTQSSLLSSMALVSVEDDNPRDILLENNYTIFIPRFKQLIPHYDFNELTFKDLSSNVGIERFQREYRALNSAPWWQSLREGNWKIFESTLSQQLEEESYEIYAGKSHKAFYPKEFVCNSENYMTFDYNSRKKHIPLYIWNYLIPRNQDRSSEEFVIVGVNSPFMTDSLVICEDICDRISWLKPLQAIRKMASFGYVFCCRPQDVHTLLDGFPQREYLNITN